MRTPETSASEYAKAMGLKSLDQLAYITQMDTRTLRNWHTTRPELFKTICMGGVQQLLNEAWSEPVPEPEN